MSVRFLQKCSRLFKKQQNS